MSTKAESQDRASPAEIQKCLKGIHYPADKKKVVGHAQKNKAPANVIHVLERVEDRQWKTPADLMKSVGKVE